ncbi:MAG: hypothetical protein HXX08_21315 [Chloroflexi bacterium]|uniref:Uncharacterized protein n=1 Tax=Candidatus Chlorohelix allophototropha TaxID=3003348 RepID=A0A8T7M8M3_9CHLR|nr:hypothetical protein [Chloroflexota bacterium]WJW68338.1 hypothetical protein OZ401_003947 [Chloroflexota bacterium L227-S17]
MMIDQLWRSIQKPDTPTEFWDKATTPLLPSVWLPVPGMIWVSYVYAAGRDFRKLADGAYIAKPWAKLEYHPGRSEPEVVVLSNKLEQAAIQGVRPLKPDEVEIYQQYAAITEKILANEPAIVASLPNLIRNYYRLWRNCNGVIAYQVKPYHSDFFKWLDEY